MDTSPVNRIGRRLEELDQQIHTCLRDIRHNLAELGKVSDKDTGLSSGAPDSQFADVLKSSIARRQSPPPTS